MIKKGKWQTWITKGIERKPIGWKCSVCDKSPIFAIKSDFCPNCGTPMTEKALEILRKREGGNNGDKSERAD